MNHFLASAIMLLTLSACAPVNPWPPERDLSNEPAEVRDLAARLMATDSLIRTDAAEGLSDEGTASLPTLRRFLETGDVRLHRAALQVVRQIGPASLPLLADLLQHRRVTARRDTVSILIDFAPDTESIQAAICRALLDGDTIVAGDAARALGALGEKAAPSVRALIGALSKDDDEHLRIYAAEALAAIGPAANSATAALSKALRDPVAGVRWAACEALGGIGPTAAPAVPRLIEALRDENLYVRICAAGALGSIKAESAVDALRLAAHDPRLRDEAEWALHRITGEPIKERPINSIQVTAPIDQSTPAGIPPLDWDAGTGRGIAWSAELGNDTFGRPVVHNGVVYIGTDNARRLDAAVTEPCGVLMAFAANDGKFLWQDVARPVERGLRDFLLPSTTSAPLVAGDRLYYVTAQGQLRCIDTRSSAKVIWELDMCGQLGVFPHEACNSEVLPLGDALIVCTSNGRNEGHTRVPSPRAPSLIAVDRKSGDVIWRAAGPGEHILHGQWSSPVAAAINGRAQILFGGGDGWLRAYDASSGREIWRFDGNPKDARWLPRPGTFSRSPILASPVFADGKVFIAMGDDPSHGDGPSLLHAINPGGQGDVTESRRMWTNRDVGRVVGTPIYDAGLLYVGDIGGTVHCIDAAKGQSIWKHPTGATIWGCMVLAEGRLYVGNEDGVMTVLRAGRRKEALAEIEMNDALYSRPALVGDSMYLATARRLYLISESARPPSPRK